MWIELNSVWWSKFSSQNKCCWFGDCIPSECALLLVNIEGSCYSFLGPRPTNLELCSLDASVCQVIRIKHLRVTFHLFLYKIVTWRILEMRCRSLPMNVWRQYLHWFNRGSHALIESKVTADRMANYLSDSWIYTRFKYYYPTIWCQYLSYLRNLFWLIDW